MCNHQRCPMHRSHRLNTVVTNTRLVKQCRNHPCTRAYRHTSLETERRHRCPNWHKAMKGSPIHTQRRRALHPPPPGTLPVRQATLQLHCCRSIPPTISGSDPDRPPHSKSPQDKFHSACLPEPPAAVHFHFRLPPCPATAKCTLSPQPLGCRTYLPPWHSTMQLQSTRRSTCNLQASSPHPDTGSPVSPANTIPVLTDTTPPFDSRTLVLLVPVPHTHSTAGT